MENLEELRNLWPAQHVGETQREFDVDSLNLILRNRIKKENNSIMRYFWAGITFNMLVYALSSHVIIRYWHDPSVYVFAILAILATIPFTYYMIKRYKAMAASFAHSRKTLSIQGYISRQKELLLSFFLFKKRYEWFLIPFNAAIGVILVFNIFLPGGVLEHISGALITFFITIVSCIFAIRSENQKRFIQPLRKLQAILDEFEKGEKKGI